MFDVPRHKENLQNQLRIQAHAEVQSWNTAAQDKRGSALEVTWDKTKKSMEAKFQTLRNIAVAGQLLSEDAKALMDIAELARESFEAMKTGICESDRLPQIHSNSLSIPRVYKAVVSYLRAVNYEFEEETFEQYAGALQEIVVLEMAELWQVRPFLELALLERIAAADPPVPDGVVHDPRVEQRTL